MDFIDIFFIEELKDYKPGKWYFVKDIPEKDMVKFVNRLYICQQRKYLSLKSADCYPQMVGNPDWLKLSFKLHNNSSIIKYYLKTMKFLPDFLKKDYKPEQFKLKI